MNDTNALEKLLASIINTVIAFIISTPFIFIKTVIDFKYIFLIVFFLYQIAIVFTKDKRCFGMIIKTYWDKDYKNINYIIYAIFYTLSFSTIIIWIVFPFDLLLVNLLLIQLPFVVFTEYTLHGYLSGKMKSVKKR